MKIEEWKALENKIVFLWPTGNNIPRSGETKHRIGTIKKVARIYVTVTFRGYDVKYKMHKNEIQDDHNAGYIVFKSLEGVEDYKIKKSLASKISKEFRYQYQLEELDLSIIKQIAKLLKII